MSARSKILGWLVASALGVGGLMSLPTAASAAATDGPVPCPAGTNAMTAQGKPIVDQYFIKMSNGPIFVVVYSFNSHYVVVGGNGGAPSVMCFLTRPPRHPDAVDKLGSGSGRLEAPKKYFEMRNDTGGTFRNVNPTVTVGDPKQVG